MKLNTLITSSILALVVLAGASLASAQQHSEHHPGADSEAATQQQGTGTVGQGVMGQGMMRGPMGQGMGMGMMGGCPVMGMMMGGGAAPSFAEGRVAFLKAELAITDAQKAVWGSYAEALKKNLQSVQGMRDTMMKMMQAKSPVERLDAHITAMESRLGALKEIKPALTALYTALSEEQKKKADTLLTGMGCMM